MDIHKFEYFFKFSDHILDPLFQNDDVFDYFLLFFVKFDIFSQSLPFKSTPSSWGKVGDEVKKHGIIFTSWSWMKNTRKKIVTTLLNPGPSLLKNLPVKCYIDPVSRTMKQVFFCKEFVR